MSLDATTLDDDLGDIFSDFNHRIEISGITYSGLYEESYIETDDFSGFQPIFTGLATEAGLASIDDTVLVTSDIENISNKAFTVEDKIPVGRTLQLVLHEV